MILATANSKWHGDSVEGYCTDKHELCVARVVSICSSAESSVVDPGNITLRSRGPGTGNFLLDF